MVLYPLGHFIYSSLSFSLIYGQFLPILLFLAHLNNCFARNKATAQSYQMGHTLHSLRRGPEPVYDTRHVWVRERFPWKCRKEAKSIIVFSKLFEVGKKGDSAFHNVRWQHTMQCLRIKSIGWNQWKWRI